MDIDGRAFSIFVYLPHTYSVHTRLLVDVHRVEAGELESEAPALYVLR